MLLIAGVLVALGAVYLVLEPILRPAAAGSPQPEPSASADDADEDDPVLRRRDLALAALKEIEFDRATGKLSEEDYQRMRARYTAEALDALRAADAATPATPRAAVPDDAIERLIAGARAGHKGRGGRGGRKFCVECGTPLEGSGRFCVECGVRTAA